MRSKLNFTSRQVNICNDINSPHSTTFLFFYPIPAYLILEKNIGGSQDAIKHVPVTNFHFAAKIKTKQKIKNTLNFKKIKGNIHRLY